MNPAERLHGVRAAHRRLWSRERGGKEILTVAVRSRPRRDHHVEVPGDHPDLHEAEPFERHQFVRRCLERQQLRGFPLTPSSGCKPEH
jgi:hypothetical protein